MALILVFLLIPCVQSLSSVPNIMLLKKITTMTKRSNPEHVRMTLRGSDFPLPSPKNTFWEEGNIGIISHVGVPKACSMKASIHPFTTPVPAVYSMDLNGPCRNKDYFGYLLMEGSNNKPCGTLREMSSVRGACRLISQKLEEYYYNDLKIYCLSVYGAVIGNPVKSGTFSTTCPSDKLLVHYSNGSLLTIPTTRIQDLLMSQSVEIRKNKETCRTKKCIILPPL